MDLSHVSMIREPTESVWKGKAKLGGWLDEPPVCSIQMAQSDLLLLAEPGRYSLTGTRSSVLLADLWLADMCSGI